METGLKDAQLDEQAAKFKTAFFKFVFPNKVYASFVPEKNGTYPVDQRRFGF